MRVLIGYDGSPGAELAIALAGALDWALEAQLEIAAVAEPVLPHYTGVRPMGTVPPPEVDPEVIELRQQQVTDAAARLSKNGREAKGVVLRGWPATALVDHASRFAADLVMAGSRGRGAVASMLLGSVSAAIVDIAPCPVLVARTSEIRRIVLAVDGSAPAAVAESLVSTWPIFEGPEVQVLSVADVMAPVQFGLAPPSYHRATAEHASAVAEEKQNHTRIAEEAAARLRAAGRRAPAMMRTGSAADEIVALAAETGADLVVMGSQGRTGLTRLVLGSVARRVLNESSASVLIARAG